nr:hypothetical protein [Brucella intermedia]
MYGRVDVYAQPQVTLKNIYITIIAVQILRDMGFIPTNSKFKMYKRKSSCSNASDNEGYNLHRERCPHFVTDSGIEVPVWNFFNANINRKHLCHIISRDASCIPSFFRHIEKLIGFDELYQVTFHAVENLLSLGSSARDVFLELVEPNLGELTFKALDNREAIKEKLIEDLQFDESTAKKFRFDITSAINMPTDGATDLTGLETILSGFDIAVNCWADNPFLDPVALRNIEFIGEKIKSREKSEIVNRADLVPRRVIQTLTSSEMFDLIQLSEKVKLSRRKLMRLARLVYVDANCLIPVIYDIEQNTKHVDLYVTSIERAPRSLGKLKLSRLFSLFFSKKRHAIQRAKTRALSQQLQQYANVFQTENKRLRECLSTLFRLHEIGIPYPSGQLASILLSSMALSTTKIDRNSALSSEMERYKTLFGVVSGLEEKLSLNKSQWSFLNSRTAPSPSELDPIQVHLISQIRSYIKASNFQIM